MPHLRLVGGDQPSWEENPGCAPIFMDQCGNIAGAELSEGDSMTPKLTLQVLNIEGRLGLGLWVGKGRRGH